MTSTLHEIQALISEHYGVPREALDPEKSMDAFGLDSLGVIELMFSIEDRSGISIPDRGPEVKTLNQLVAWVDSLRGASASPLPAQ